MPRRRTLTLSDEQREELINSRRLLQYVGLRGKGRLATALQDP